jgi:hypothetical protein
MVFDPGWLSLEIKVYLIKSIAETNNFKLFKIAVT